MSFVHQYGCTSQRLFERKAQSGFVQVNNQSTLQNIEAFNLTYWCPSLIRVDDHPVGIPRISTEGHHTGL